MKRYYIMPKKIISNMATFHFITCMYNVLSKITYSEICFDFSSTKYIEPNMMAPLGMIFNKIKSQQNKTFLSNLSQNIKDMLLKYNFIHLEDFDNEISQSYIKYENFNGDAVEEYRNYLYDQFIDIKSNDAVELLISNIMEIFINVKMHARSYIDKSRYGNKEVFSSGYYNNGEDYILFSISNNGWTFAENIKNRLKIEYTNHVSYIEWAINHLNSTTDEHRPGGVGLKKLRELITETNGMIIICSGRGYFSLGFEGNILTTMSKDLMNPFPGTCITVKIPITASLKKINEEGDGEISLLELIGEMI